ncbi:hypothetical protein J5J86_14080 [Aquabacter sp. L1I39]|uniref:hypothetical protein n=1 Tax=Aquabacter sp. L1I39 TaxID=2820278 RepID=UPI001AD988E2|nr:hypothetical protein [Aquabacter sp. L1I39]QTL01934.1 hypothetical protein J5J86_14080 [Aquabacter sp. L1I39]
MTSIDTLLRIFDAYSAATGLAETTVSTRVFQDGKRIAALRLGGDMGVRRTARAVQWFSANWPEGADWPEGITRPAPTDSQEAA